LLRFAVLVGIRPHENIMPVPGKKRWCLDLLHQSSRKDGMGINGICLPPPAWIASLFPSRTSTSCEFLVRLGSSNKNP